MTAGLRGLDLLDAAIDQIEAHPETWVQGSYRCESGMCLAGWAVTLAGGKWLYPASQRSVREYLAPEPDDAPDDICDDGVPAHFRAERLIGFRFVGGVTDDRDLFGAENTLDGIKALRDELRAGAK
jgi:hypothetical protein